MMRTFDHLPFCRRWLDREDGGSTKVNGVKGRQVGYMDALEGLVRKGIVEVGSRVLWDVGLSASCRHPRKLFFTIGAYVLDKVELLGMDDV